MKIRLNILISEIKLLIAILNNQLISSNLKLFRPITRFNSLKGKIIAFVIQKDSIFNLEGLRFNNNYVLGMGYFLLVYKVDHQYFRFI